MEFENCLSDLRLKCFVMNKILCKNFMKINAFCGGGGNGNGNGDANGDGV